MVAVVVRVPQPVEGLRFQVTPASFVSLETVAVSSTEEVPAGIVVEELDEVRLTAMGLLPLPQAVRNRKKIKAKAERTTLFLRIRAPWHNKIERTSCVLPLGSSQLRLLSFIPEERKETEEYWRGLGEIGLTKCLLKNEKISQNIMSPHEHKSGDRHH